MCVSVGVRAFNNGEVIKVLQALFVNRPQKSNLQKESNKFMSITSIAKYFDNVKFGKYGKYFIMHT